MRSIVATTFSSSAILMKSFGASSAFGRMVPARQRLDADDRMRRGVELRLVVGDEFVALQPRQDVVGDALGGDDLGLQRIVEELVAVAAAALGPVERQVGVDQQPARIGDLVEIAGDADRDAEAAFVALIGHRLVHLLDDAVGERGEQLAPAQLVGALDLAEHHELVAADAGDEIARSQIGLQHARGMHQHGVAGGVAERVVDLLEAVEVEMQQAGPLALRSRISRYARPAPRRDSGDWAGRSANRAAN